MESLQLLQNEAHSDAIISALQERIEDLESLNDDLASNLSRKYNHCKRLKRKVDQLQTIIEGETLISQSGAETTVAVGEGSDNIKAEITTFADEDAGWTTDIKSSYEPTMSLADNNDSDLGNWLSRPIRAATYNWAINTPLYEELNPWAAFLGNKYVFEKLANYELLRMKLHMKVVISGTPFHYGRALVSYNPLSQFDDVTTERNFLDIDLIQASQKPHIFLNPASNTGGELSMPFFFRENYMSLSKADAPGLGKVDFKSFGLLQHTDTGNPVTITVYLWATDIVLTMPTSLTSLPSQAGKQKAMNSNDEYGQGIISKPAKAIAKAMGMLEDVPIIGPYARATEMVASGVGDVAKLFGYSRPPVITDTMLVKPSPTGNLCNVDAAEAVQKLTLDSKCEVTIDPRVTGLGAEDEMSIASIAERESYLTTFAWDVGSNVDDMLWNSRVTPNLYDSAGDEIHMVPMALLAQYFNSWQGSIKFRFQVVKSQYHKGRLLVRYDPRSHGADVNYNTAYSRVIDIADSDDFEIVIGWGQNSPFLDNSTAIASTINFSDTSRLSTDNQSRHNGVIEVNVLNDLVSPSADSSISINVFVSACDDFKWADPKEASMNRLHLFPKPLVSQSGAENSIDNPLEAQQLDAIGSVAPAADQTMNVFFGDSPTTLRELFKRYVATRTWVAPVPTAGSLNINQLVIKDMPYHSGYDSQGMDTDSTGAGCVYTNTHPISFFSPCYAGYRGGMRRKYLFNAPDGTNPNITRSNFNGPGVSGQYSTENILFADLSSGKLSSNANQQSARGAASTNIGVNNSIEVELPFYSTGRMGYPRILGAIQSNSNTHVVQTIDVNSSIPTVYEEWTAAAEDYSLYFFTGVPIMYNYLHVR